MNPCICGQSLSYPYCDGSHKNKIQPHSSKDMASQMKLADKTGEVLFLKGFMKQSPDWKDFVDLINYQYNNPLENESTISMYSKISNILFSNKQNKNANMYKMGNLGLHLLFVNTDNDPDHKFYNMKHLDTFLSIFKKENSSHVVKCLINFAGNELNGNIHSDRQDVVSWTCAGEVEYRIYDIKKDENKTEITIEETEDLPYKSYIIQSGDVLYMPKGIFHKAISDSPRASLILDISKNTGG